jgi:serine/threonine protein kinase/tetratricopeptide (TPR) repeat protein
MTAMSEDYGRLKLIGSGGTARVYLDHDPATKKPFALKTILPESESTKDDFVRLIERESSLIGDLKYPGIVRVTGIDNSVENPSLSLEYCPGITLDQIDSIDDTAALLNIISSISIDLYYLYLAGMAHGDLKPHNLFLTGTIEDHARNNAVYVKLSDFSLALKNDETDSDRLGLGTVGYIAPETLDNKILNHHSDIFALGIIAYKLATGHHPFMDNDHDPVRVNSRIKEDNPTAPKEINETIPDALSDLIMSMLSKNPDRRPKDCFAICEELEKAGASLPFRRMIRPKHIIDLYHDNSPGEFLRSSCLDFKDNVMSVLLDYGGDKICSLRSILEINFSRCIIGWSGGRLTRHDDGNHIIWPKRIRKRIWSRFSKLPYSKQKKCIQASVCESSDDCITLGVINENDIIEFASRPLITCLKRSASVKTIVRTANNLGLRAVESNLLPLAANLFLTAGNIGRAHKTAMPAVNELKGSNDYAKAIILLERLEKLCQARDDSDKLRGVLGEKALIQKLTGEISASIETCNQIVSLCRNNTADRFLADIYKELGDLYKMTQDFTSGLEALEKAEKIYLKTDDQLELSHTLNNIGNIYWIDSRYDLAFTCYRRALRIQRRLKATEDVASTLNNIAPIYYFRQRYARCLRIYSLSLKLKKEIGNQLEIARTMNNMGFVYSELGDFDKSLDYLTESRNINHKIGNSKELLFNLENLTQVMLSAGKLRDSFKYLKEGMNLSDKLGDLPHKGVFLRGMGNVQKWMGLYGQAGKNLQQAIDICLELEDHQRLIICLVQQADLLVRINAHQDTEKVCREIAALAEKLDDRRATIIVNLVRCRMNRDIDAADRAVKIAQEIKNNRDLHLAKLYKAECHLICGQPDEADSVIQSLIPVFTEKSSDILKAWLHNICGMYYKLIADFDKALMHYNRGLDLAVSSALLPEKLEAMYNLGTIHAHQNDFENAFKYFKTAFNDARTIAQDIDNEEYRRMYLQDRKIISMTDEIKKLNSILSKN